MRRQANGWPSASRWWNSITRIRNRAQQGTLGVVDHAVLGPLDVHLEEQVARIGGACRPTQLPSVVVPAPSKAPRKTGSKLIGEHPAGAAATERSARWEPIPRPASRSRRSPAGRHRGRNTQRCRRDHRGGDTRRRRHPRSARADGPHRQAGGDRQPGAARPSPCASTRNTRAWRRQRRRGSESGFPSALLWQAAPRSRSRDFLDRKIQW